ncbi:MAG: hypothetical protein L6U16_12960 [Porphyromonadaceae bacterium]|nr:MAG: hypothetical protein L6U16_12960 [Porphyromonadaceae bacterium]
MKLKFKRNMSKKEQEQVKEEELQQEETQTEAQNAEVESQNAEEEQPAKEETPEDKIAALQAELEKVAKGIPFPDGRVRQLPQAHSEGKSRTHQEWRRKGYAWIASCDRRL